MLTVKLWTLIMLTGNKENKLSSNKSLHFYNAVNILTHTSLHFKIKVDMADMKVDNMTLNKKYFFQTFSNIEILFDIMKFSQNHCVLATFLNQ